MFGSNALARLGWAIILFGVATGVAAQQYGDERMLFASESWDATFFYEGGTYEPDIPTPEAILGFPIGRRPVRYDEMRRYLEALANASARVTMRVHARTHEGRELIHLAISREGRVSDSALNTLQQRMSRFADPRTGGPDTPESDLPLVAWFGYSIHGDELSGCDAAVQIAYQLAAGTDAVTSSLRDSVLVFIDPNQNADGRERYLAQMQAAAGRVPNPDSQSLQHRGFWPWGRANHYLFDLNRDWFTLVHPESRGRVAAMTQWNPQLVIDGHEMGWNDTYLFSPPREPFNPNLPRSIRRWWDIFAADQAAAFGERGWSHYTREWNEEFFPGYGSSWAMYHGAIGILYEQAGVDGSVVRQSDGSYLTYRESVQHQFRSTIANIETAMRHRTAILRDYRAGRRQAVETGGSGPVRAYVFIEGDDPQRARHLAQVLHLQGIEVRRADESLTLQNAHDFWGGSWKRKTVPAGSYVVLLEQPAAPLVRNLMDFHVAMPDSFLREERDWLERNKGSRLYEVTTWSRPPSSNVETYWVPRLPSGRTSAWEPSRERTQSPSSQRPSYAYIIDGRRDASMHAVALLLERGMNVRIALEGFSVGGKHFARGSALLRVRANPESLHDVVREVATVANVAIHPTDSGHADDGPDLGGSRFPALTAPRIALLTGYPISFVSYGSLWHLLDHDIQIRVSSLDVQGVRSMDLSKYNVIVLPNAFGGASAYTRALGPRGTENLLTWVKAGGTLVAVGAGTAFAADSSRGFSSVRLRRDVLAQFAPSLAKGELPETQRMDALGDAPRKAAPIAMPLLGAGATAFVKQTRPRGVEYVFAKEQTAAMTPALESKPTLEHLKRADARLRRFYPQGALLRADVDQDDWLTAGVPARLPILLDNSRALIARAPVRVPARFAEKDSLHLSGLLWPEAADRIGRTACVTRERVGKGQVILFAGDPTYRRATLGSERLVLNALLLGPGLGTQRPAPW
jgi:hypothetical protein